MRIGADDIQLTIASLVEARLQTKALHAKIDASFPLYDAGLTSFDIVAIVLDIEKTYTIKFPDEEIGPSNFQSISSIAAVTLRVLRP